MSYDVKSTIEGDKSEFTMSGAHAFGGLLAVCYDLNNALKVPVRAELEFGLFSKAKTENNSYTRRNDGGIERDDSKLDIDIKTLFVNVNYDFRNSSAFTPYLGAGLGVAFVDAKFKGSGFDSQDVDSGWSLSLKKDSSVNFAWNLHLGMTYAFTDMVGLDLGYSFISVGKGKTKNDSFSDDDPTSRAQCKTENLFIHQLALGARLSF